MSRLVLRICLLCFACSLVSPAGAESRKFRVALVDLQSEKAMRGLSLTVSEYLRVKLVQAGIYEVLERGRLREILEEQALQQTGITNVDNAVRTGRILNCQKMFVGVFSRLGERYFLSIECVDVETTRVDFADSVEVNVEGELKRAAEYLIDRMIVGWYRYLWWMAPRWAANAAGTRIVTRAYRETEEEADSARNAAKTIGEYQAASALYDKMADLAPNGGAKVEAVFMTKMTRARSAELKGDMKEAVELYRQASMEAPDEEAKKAALVNWGLATEAVAAKPTVPSRETPERPTAREKIPAPAPVPENRIDQPGTVEGPGYRELRLRMVEEQIAARGVKDAAVLAAMRKVPRHLFVPSSSVPQAYEDHPAPIGFGVNISQPYIVALMSELLSLEPGEKILEIGTGSGYQAAVLAEMGGRVYSIEIVPQMAERAAVVLRERGYGSVKVKAGDGYKGWPEYAPFKRIIITAAAPYLPQPLIDQLEEGGRLVAPVGDDRAQYLEVADKVGGRIQRRREMQVIFSPMTGEVRKER